MENSSLEFAPNPAHALIAKIDNSIENLLGLALPNRNETPYFGFRIENLALLVPAHIHCEVIEQTRANPIPNTKAWFSGVVNLRGNLVPVFDLSLWLGEVTAEVKKRRLFTIGKGERAVALWIDGLPEVFGIEGKTQEIQASLPVVLSPFVLSSHSHRERVWDLLDYEALFKTLGSQIAH